MTFAPEVKYIQFAEVMHMGGIKCLSVEYSP
jgi:hypothetical protein